VKAARLVTLVALRARDVLSLVMPGLVPAIHVLLDGCKKDVDGRA